MKLRRRPKAESQPEPEPDFYEQTRFWTLTRSYGFRGLFATPGWALALLGGVVLGLFLEGCLKVDGLKALGVAYISLGAALFGIVLAGLAVVAAFFDPDYVRRLREANTLAPSLFGFWWVAALAVASLITSVALTVVVYAGMAESITAVALTLATMLFLAALLDALSLVGTVMRHGLYRAELAANETKVSRTQEP